MPRTAAPLVLIAAGGTIGMARRDPAGDPSRLSAAQLLAATGDDRTRVRCVDVPYPDHRIASLDDVLRLARIIETQAHRGVAGIVVTHGTDALEEVAYAVDEMVSGVVPIVFTGAMRPPWAADSDGARNLRDALRVATCAAPDWGTLVTLHGHVFEALSVYKQDSTAPDAFAARRGTPSALVRGEGVEPLESRWTPTRWNRLGRIPERLPPGVAIVTLGVGDDTALLGPAFFPGNAGVSPASTRTGSSPAVGRTAPAGERLTGSGIHGLVVASQGAGTLPPAAFDRLCELARAGLPVVCCAGTPSGPVAAHPWYPAAYEALTRAGLILEDHLSPRKARLRLMLSLALGRGYAPVRIREEPCGPSECPPSSTFRLPSSRPETLDRDKGTAVSWKE